jgi:hypothetical protein
MCPEREWYAPRRSSDIHARRAFAVADARLAKSLGASARARARKQRWVACESGGTSVTRTREVFGIDGARFALTARIITNRRPHTLAALGVGGTSAAFTGVAAYGLRGVVAFGVAQTLNALKRRRVAEFVPIAMLVDRAIDARSSIVAHATSITRRRTEVDGGIHHRVPPAVHSAVGRAAIHCGVEDGAACVGRALFALGVFEDAAAEEVAGEEEKGRLEGHDEDLSSCGVG